MTPNPAPIPRPSSPPLGDVELLERLTRAEIDCIDLEDARAALKEAEETGTIPLRDLVRDLD